jgi:SEC-C motif-containing protein
MKKRKKKRSSARFGHGLCPCHSGDAYATCCRPYHKGEALAPSPERLMRSRYAAYATGRADYIIETTDPMGPHHQQDRVAWKEGIDAFCAETEFIGLTIEHVLEEPENAHGEVRFLASLRQGGEHVEMREHSVFRRAEDGRWLYTGELERVG